MNVVIVLEIVVGIFVLAAAARFAVRDARQRRGVTESTDTGEASARGSEHAAQQHPTEAAEQREAVVAVSASSTAPEPPADAR
ncbi:MAG TPA: hypothetical protein VJT72_15265 [Pseudonocardiaceae bacterium]|nr:hypothetical protein [Pseudonocardiaceae bacterium]